MLHSISIRFDFDTPPTLLRGWGAQLYLCGEARETAIMNCAPLRASHNPEGGHGVSSWREVHNERKGKVRPRWLFNYCNLF